MHITEGIITGTPAVLYTAAGVALVGYGAMKMKKFVALNPEKRPLLGMAGALIFFVSLLPIPAFSGTCSHPCGTPFIAMLFGPAIGIALTGGSLLLQAAFFAHGGFSTWGANVVALGFFGCLAGWSTYVISRKIGLPLWAAGFAGGFIGDVVVYVASGLILAGELANAPTPQYSFTGYLLVIYGAYLPTQLPIAIGEMVVSGLALHYIYRQRPEVLVELGLVKLVPSPLQKSVPTALLLLLLLVPAVLLSIGRVDVFAAEKQEVTSGLALSSESSQREDSESANSFSGMDEAVNEKLAEEAGLAPKDPLLNTEAMGDIWNALLLIAGAVCGFIVGRWWHLIGEKGNNDKKVMSLA